MREWVALVESKSGERGIFSRVAAQAHVENNGRREHDHEFGCNPCSEILLRPYQFCNLSEVVVRATDTPQTLKKKVKIATIIGTVQSMFTYMPYLRPVWNKNTDEERLLGVSLTGIMDNEYTKILNHPFWRAFVVWQYKQTGIMQSYLQSLRVRLSPVSSLVVLCHSLLIPPAAFMLVILTTIFAMYEAITKTR